MANISFIAILIGAAGVAGGIERGNMVGTISAAAVHTAGVVGMYLKRRMKGDDGTDEGDEGVDPSGSSPVDKPSGTCRHAHSLLMGRDSSAEREAGKE